MAGWVSAFATLAAALVALFLPLRIQRLENERKAAEDRAVVVEIWATIVQVLRNYLYIRQESEAGNPNPNPTRYRQIATECAATAAALERLLAQPALSSDVLVSGSAAITVAHSTASAANLLADNEFFSAHAEVTENHHVAQLANSRNEIVRARHQIEWPAGQDRPVI